MNRTNYKENQQCAGLNAVLLMGGYSVCGRIIVDDVATYTMTWLVSVAVVIVFWIFFTILRTRHPKTARDTGRALIPVIAVAYLTAVAGLYLNGFISLWQQWALPNTSSLVLAASAALLSVYGGCRGVRPALRLCLPVGLAVLVLFLLDTALLVPEMSPARLGVADAGFDVFAFLELTAAMLLSMPASFILLDEKKENLSYRLIGINIGLGYLLINVLRSVMVLGQLTVFEPYPLLRSLMLVYIGPGLGRMEAGGLMALSAAMLAAVMAFIAGAISMLPVCRRKSAAKALIWLALTAMGLF